MCIRSHKKLTSTAVHDGQGKQDLSEDDLGQKKGWLLLHPCSLPLPLWGVDQANPVPGYTLGVDGGSFKVRGLKKMIDIVIRWFYFSQYCLITSSGTGTSQGVRGVRLLTSSWTFMRLDTSRLMSKWSTSWTRWRSPTLLLPRCHSFDISMVYFHCQGLSWMINVSTLE